MQQQGLFQLTGIDQLIPVHGMDGAMAYNVGPNCRVPLFDDSDDVFYIKSTDKYGVPTIKRYRFEEEILLDGTDPKAVSLKDIRSIIKEELDSIKEELLNVQQPISDVIDSTEDIQSTTNNSTSRNTKSNKTARDKQQRSDTTDVENG